MQPLLSTQDPPRTPSMKKYCPEHRTNVFCSARPRLSLRFFYIGPCQTAAKARRCVNGPFRINEERPWSCRASVAFGLDRSALHNCPPSPIATSTLSIIDPKAICFPQKDSTETRRTIAAFRTTEHEEGVCSAAHGGPVPCSGILVACIMRTCL
jgi:hypothetical protein